MTRFSTLVACLLLAACVPATEPGSTTSAAAELPDPGAKAAVAPARAFSVFSDVCGGSLPNFASAPSRMASAGVTVTASTGTTYSATEDLSFQIRPGPGLGQTCSMVFGTTASESAVASAVSVFGTFRPTPFGNATLFQNTGAMVLLGGTPTRTGGRTYFNIRMLSER